MAVVAGKSNNTNYILVNSNLSIQEQNFHGIHELIHIYTSKPHSGQKFNCYDRVKPNQSSYIEWVANEGSAELILPYKELLPFIKDNISSFDNKTLPIWGLTYLISHKYPVSQTVVQNRLNNLKYEIYQYLNGTDINNIEILSSKQQQSRGIYIDSLVDIETKRLMDCLTNHKSIVNSSFFDYSESYRDSKIAVSL